MALDILGYRDKHKDFYGDSPLEEVAKDAFTRGGYDKKYPDYNTWKRESGIDADIEADRRLRNPTFEDKLRTAVEQPKGDDGNIVKSFLQGGAEGLTTELPSMIGGALQFTGSHLPFKGIEKAGKSIKDWAEEKRQELYGPEIERTGLDRIVYEGTKMLAPSLIPGGVAGTIARGAKGVNALLKAGKVAEATAAAKSATNIAGGSVAALFGLSQAQQTKDTAEQEGVDPGLAPYVTGAIEAAGEFLGTKYLAKLFRLDEAEIVQRGTKEFVKDLIKTIGVETGTEIGQASGEAAVEKYSGIRPNANPIMEAIDVIGPTAFMTILTGGLAGAANKLRSQDPEEKAAAQYIEKLKAGAMFSMAINEGLSTGQYEGSPFTSDHAIEVIKEAQNKGVFDDTDIDRFKDKYPQLRDGLNGVIAENVINKVSEAVKQIPWQDFTLKGAPYQEGVTVGQPYGGEILRPVKPTSPESAIDASFKTISRIEAPKREKTKLLPGQGFELSETNQGEITTLQERIQKVQNFLDKNEKHKGGKKYQQVLDRLEEDKARLAELTKGGEDNGTLRETETTVEEKPGETSAATPWFRGIDQVNKATGDKFYSASNEVAGDFGEVSEMADEEMPKNPLVVSSKEDLVEAIGYKHDPLAEPKDIPKEERFDVLAKKYAQEKGHDGIIYEEGTLGERELHAFGTEQLPAPLSQTDAATVGKVDEAKSGESSPVLSKLQSSIHAIPDGTRGKKQIAAALEELNGSSDSPVKALSAIQRMKNNLMHMGDGNTQLQNDIDAIEQHYKKQGYEIDDLLGRKYDPGMKVIATWKPGEGEWQPATITKIIKPQINKDGVMSSAAQIEVTDWGEKPTAPAKTSTIETPKVKGAEIVEPAANVEVKPLGFKDEIIDGTDNNNVKTKFRVISAEPVQGNPSLDTLIDFAKKQGLKPAESDAFFTLVRGKEIYRPANEFVEKDFQGSKGINADKIKEAYTEFIKTQETALPAPLSQTDAATVGVTQDEAKSGESLNLEVISPTAEKVKTNHPVYGQKELDVIEEYGGQYIAKAENGNIAVVSKDGRKVFFPALDDSYAPHKWVTSENNIESARKYLDWLNKKVAQIKPELKKESTHEKKTETLLKQRGFSSLPQHSQDKFNAAFETKDVKTIQSYLASDNIKAEFEKRTGLKLPKDKKKMHKAVAEHFKKPKEKKAKSNIVPVNKAQNALQFLVKAGKVRLGPDYSAKTGTAWDRAHGKKGKDQSRELGKIAEFTSKNGKLSMDEAADMLNAEGFQTRDGGPWTDEKLFQEGAYGDLRNVLHPEHAERIIEKRIEDEVYAKAIEQEEEYFDQQREALAQEGIDAAGEIEENSKGVRADLISEIENEGHLTEEQLEAAHDEISSFFDEMSKAEETPRTETTDAGEQHTLAGLSAAETFTLTANEPETPVVKGAKLTPKNLQPKEKVGDMFAEKEPEDKTDEYLKKEIISYSKELKITNLDELPKGTGAQYLLAIKGENGELIAKQWRRTIPHPMNRIEVLIDFGQKSEKQEEPAKEKPTKGMDRIREHYTPGNVIYSDYWGEYDKVLSFNEKDGQWNVDVIHVNKDGSPIKGEQPRNHATVPSKRDRIEIKATESKVEAKESTTDDSGVELSYNKRNRIKTGIKWEDIKDKNTALKVKETNKQNVYPKPDYQQMIDDGMEPMIAHIVKQIYDSIPIAPTTSGTLTDEVMQRYITAVNRVMDGAIQWANDKGAIAAWAGKQARYAGAALGKVTNITDLAQTNKSLLDIVYPEGYKAYIEEIRILGGNKVLKALQPGYDQGKKAMKEIGTGWPGKLESWQKQGYAVVERRDVKVPKGWTDSNNNPIFMTAINGRTFGERYKTQEEAEASIDKMQPFILVDKYSHPIGQFDTIEEAQEAAREKVKRENKPTINEKGISVESAKRTGEQRREPGENITTDRLREAFGFKGVNFGNWMKGDTNEAERQLHLNHAYDSFMDLAEILNVPPKAISLNGFLGVAIGAQGSGAHAAHFVPGLNEINLTRTAGAGAMVHEWGHALDHYFANQAGLESNRAPYITENVGPHIDNEGYLKRGGQKVKAFSENIRPEIVSLFNKIVHAMNKKTINITPEEQAEQLSARKEDSKKRIDSWLRNIKEDFIRNKVDENNFEKLADRIRNLDLGEGKVAVSGGFSMSPVVSELRNLYKEKTGRAYSLDQIKGLQSNIDHYKYIAEKEKEEHIPQTRETRTEYINESAKADKGKSKDYWSTEREMFARAFDAFITDTIEEKAAINTYLSGLEAIPPRGEERKTINQAFRDLIGEIQTRETDKGVEMYSVRGMYSQLEKVVTEKLSEMPAKIQSIPKWLERQGVKPAEMKWMGVEQWLNENQATDGKIHADFENAKPSGRIDKQAFADFLKENQIEVEEITKGAVNQRAINEQLRDLRTEKIRLESAAKPYTDNYEDAPQNILDAYTAVTDKISKLQLQKDRGDNTKFAQYQLPGGENYRELLLTLPIEKLPGATQDIIDKATDDIREVLARRNELTEEAEDVIDKWWKNPTDENSNEVYYITGEDTDIYTKDSHVLANVKNQYQSAHWSEPNVLAHVRMNDRTDADGKKVLFLEEVQSDLHQEGKKKGYAKPYENIVSKVQKNQDGLWEALDKNGDNIWTESFKGQHDTEETARNRAEWYFRTKDRGVPPAPFAENWHELVMKRMLRYAAENGYDKIAWTTGKTQIDRYEEALRQNVDEIRYEPAGEGLWEISAHKNGKSTFNEDEVNSERLQELLGKNVSAKIIADQGELIPGQPYREWRVIKGEDLSIGGEGMKSFYDNLIPGFMNRYVKQWGAKVGTTGIRTQDKYLGMADFIEHQKKAYPELTNEELRKAFENHIADTPVHSIDITPAMQESVMQGQPMYSKNTPGPYQMPGLADVQAVFKGQKVTQLPTGAYLIETKNGASVIVSAVDKITPSKISLNIGYSKTGISENEAIAGRYDKGMIDLVKGQADKWTLTHESVHFMEDIGVINNQEVKLLKNHIKNFVSEGQWNTLNKDDIGGSEDRAEFLAQSLQKEPRGLLGRIINKIQDFIDKLVNAFGIRTVRGIQRDIRTGDIYGKETNEQREARLDLEGGLTEQNLSDTNYSMTPKKGTASDIPAKTTPQAEAGLIEEAKKYKTAEDFINDKLFYHGSETKNVDFKKALNEYGSYKSENKGYVTQTEGVYLTKSNKIAKGYGHVGEYVVDVKNPFVGDVHDFYKTRADEALETFNEEYSTKYKTWEEAFKKEGDLSFEEKISDLFTEATDESGIDHRAILFGGLPKGYYGQLKFNFDRSLITYDFKNAGYDAQNDIVASKDKQFIVFDPDNIKPINKKQLTDIWNKAHELPNPSRPPEVGGNKGQYQIRKQTDPPVSRDPKVLNLYLKDETDAIVQTIMNKLRPKSMTWLETMLKSPEWFDHPQIQNIVKLFMRDRNEIYHETFNELNAFNDSTVTDAAKALRNKGLSLTERLSGKVSPEYQTLMDMIDDGDTRWVRNKKIPLETQLKHFEDAWRKKGATDEIINVWRSFRKSYDKALDLMTKQLRDMIEEIKQEAIQKGEKPDLSELNQTLKGALAQMEEWRGFYAPRQRQGNWAVQAYKEHGPLEQNREWYRAHHGSELSAQREAKQLERDGWRIYKVGETEKLPESVYQDVRAVSTAKLIDAALDKLGKKIDLDQMAKFNEEILKEVSDMIKSRGFRSTMIHRGRGNVVRGFIEDPIERHLMYINSVSGGISKARVARMAMKELLGDKVMGEQVGGIDPTKEPKAFSTAQDYIREQLRNSDPSDRIIGLAKSIATFKFLGFNLRSLAVNTTAILTTAPAAIHQYVTGGKGSMTEIFRELAKAGKDYGLVMSGKDLGNPDEAAFIADVHKKGWDDAQYTREALGEIAKTHSKVWSTMMDASMYLFGKSEQWNRGTTMLAAYRMARKQGLNHADAAERAKTSSDKAHGVYGKSTMPMWAQGTNPAAKIGQMMYVYSKFGHNYLQMLYDMGLKQKNIKGAMFAFLSPLVLAGGAALPFKDAIFGFAGAILSLLGFDDDPEKWVWDQIRDHLGGGAEKVGRHGLTGAMGVDISGSLSIGVGIPKNFIDLTGAIGGVATEIKEAGENLGRGQYSKAAEHILPTGFANPLRAIRESEEGVTTRNNRRVWNEKGRPYVPDTGATVARAFGFRSSDQAVLSERTWEGHRQQSQFAEKRNSIYERYRAWILGGRDREEYKEIVKDVQEFNAYIRRNRIRGESFITSQSLRNQVRRMQRPSKKERSILEE